MDSLVLPSIKSALQKELLALDAQLYQNVSLYRVRTVFPFVRGTDYEMSLESNEEVLVFSTSKKDNADDGDESPTTKLQGRWSSIDDFAETDERVLSTVEHMKWEPDAETFANQIHQFLGFNKKYGDGWITAMKIKVAAGSETRVVKVWLKDIGLAPQNYTETCIIQDANTA